MFSNLLLIISGKPDIERDSVADARARRKSEGLEDDTPFWSRKSWSLSPRRYFILNAKLATCSVNGGKANADEAAAFVGQVAKHAVLPASCVIDAGMLADKGWAVVEMNASWGSGLNGHDPERAAECIGRASFAEPD